MHKNTKVNTTRCKKTFRISPRSMKQLSKRKCWWSWRRIVWMLKLTVCKSV